MKLFLATLLGAAATAQTHAQTFYVRVERALTSPCIGGVEHDQDHSATQPLTLALSTCALRVKITASSGVNLPRITLVDGPVWPVQISLGSSFSEVGAPPTTQGNNWNGLSAAGLQISQFYGGIGGTLNGSIDVDQLYRFDAAGSIAAPVISTAIGASGICIVESPTITSAGSVLVRSGSVTRVKTTGAMAGSVTAGVSGGTAGTLTLVDVGGNCTADIRSYNGSITTLNVAGNLSGPVRAEEGSIGTIDVTGVIDSPLLPGNVYPIRAKSGIDRVFAASASASFNLFYTDGIGKIGLFKMESGNYSGMMNLKTLTPPASGSETGINIAGDLTGSIRFFENGTITEPVKIFGSISSGATIIYDEENSLTNQIIINTLGVTDGVWGGTVTVDGVELLPKPAYDNLPSSFGGGAVGVAHFGFHELASSPQHEAVVTTSLSSAVIDHYGPVINTETGLPIRVDRRPAGSTNENDFVNVSNLFSETVESTSPYRHVTVTRTGTPGLYESGYEYRMRPVGGAVAGTTRLKGRYNDNSVSIQNYDYRFTVLPPYDMNGDDLVNLTDVALWPGDPRDFNDDLVADTVDFGMLLNAAGNP